MKQRHITTEIILTIIIGVAASIALIAVAFAVNGLLGVA